MFLNHAAPPAALVSGFTVLALGVLPIGSDVAYLFGVVTLSKVVPKVDEDVQDMNREPLLAAIPSKDASRPALAGPEPAEASMALERQAGGGFKVAYKPGLRDVVGRFMGGTEIRVLVGHGRKLFAGNGYWMDRPGPEGAQGAQILVLDAPGAHWQVDHAFEDRMEDGRRRDIAVSTLAEITFTTNGAGQRLPRPISMLIASTWDLSGRVRFFTRNGRTGTWTATALPTSYARETEPHPQVRSFALHQDRLTGVDLVFVGLRPNGILSGVFDGTAPGRIRLNERPELDLSAIAETALPGAAAGQLRVSSFAACNRRLYAAIGQQIYERVDGARPTWRMIYSNRSPGRSQTGLRGLTAMKNPAGPGQVLIAAIEGTEGRIVRIDPSDGSETTDLDLKRFLAEAWGMPVGYTITAYNDFAKVRDRQGGDLLLTGFEAFIRPDATVAPGHRVVDVGRDRHLESGAWYVIRRPDGRYDLRAIEAGLDQHMIAARSIMASPFPNDPDGVYFGGYDANRFTAHNTAWLVRADVETAVGEAP